jgi:hypothetical protein
MKSLISLTFWRPISAVIAMITLACLVSVPAIGAGNAKGKPFQADRIEGLWTAHVNITVCATGMVITSFDAMALFAANGTFHDTNSVNPALRSASFGRWQHLGGNEYEFVFRFFRFDLQGFNEGWSVVRHKVELSADGQAYSSEGTAEFYNVSGGLIMTGCSDSEATRFN